MWATWTKTFREKNGVSQEAAAEMLGVEARTIRRWEAGQEPSQTARQRLSPLLAPSPAHLMGDFLVALLDSSPDFILLLDKDLRVLANSKSHQRFMHRHHGVDNIVGRTWQHYLPHSYVSWLEARGWTKGLLEDGFVSRRTPFVYTPKRGEPGKLPMTGYSDHTLLRLASGPVHMSVTSQLPLDAGQLIQEDETLLLGSSSRP